MYTVKEVADKLGVAENTIRNWIAKNEVDVQIEIRNGKSVKVVPDEELQRLLNLNEQGEQTQREVNVEHQSEMTALAMQYVREEITRRDSKIEQLYEQIARLENEKGQLQGENITLQSQLEATLQDVAEWRREQTATINHLRLPWWKRILGR